MTNTCRVRYANYCQELLEFRPTERESERGVDSTLLNGTRARAVLYKGMRQPQITGFSDCFYGSKKGTQIQTFPLATR